MPLASPLRNSGLAITKVLPFVSFKFTSGTLKISKMMLNYYTQCPCLTLSTKLCVVRSGVRP